MLNRFQHSYLAPQEFTFIKPDLVILDSSMPVLDGIGAGRKIRAALPDVPVLLYTFVASARIAGAAIEAGIQAVIEKADSLALVKESESSRPFPTLIQGLSPDRHQSRSRGMTLGPSIQAVDPAVFKSEVKSARKRRQKRTHIDLT